MSWGPTGGLQCTNVLSLGCKWHVLTLTGASLLEELSLDRCLAGKARKCPQLNFYSFQLLAAVIALKDAMHQT